MESGQFVNADFTRKYQFVLFQFIFQSTAISLASLGFSTFVQVFLLQPSRILSLANDKSPGLSPKVDWMTLLYMKSWMSECHPGSILYPCLIKMLEYMYVPNS